MKRYKIPIISDPFLVQCIRGKMRLLGYHREALEWHKNDYKWKWALTYQDAYWEMYNQNPIGNFEEITLKQFFKLKEKEQ